MQALANLEQEETLLLEQVLKLSRRIESYYANNRLANFIPFPGTPQEDFFKNATKKFRALFAGNRFGKSTAGVVEDCCWLLGERPFYPKEHPLRRAGIPSHGVKGLVIAEDWSKVREIFTEDRQPDQLGKFFHWLPPESIAKVTRRQNGTVDSITVENEIDGRKRTSILHFETVHTFLLNPRAVESSDWDFVHCDEPNPQKMWSAVARGLIDRGGSTWWLLTPIAFPWMYDEAVEGAKRRPDLWWYAEASIHQNPTLDETMKKEYLRGLPEDERRARETGKPLAHGRLVYSYFGERHLLKDIPPEWRYNEDVALWLPPFSYFSGVSIDPHPQTPHAVLFTTISPTGAVYHFHEIFEKCSITELADKIRAITKHLRVGWTLCDPSAWVEDPETGRCFADYFARSGVGVQKASKNKTHGITLTNDFFKSEREIKVFPHLTNFLKEIRRYIYNRENKPRDSEDHLMEAMYRTVLHTNLEYRDIEMRDSVPTYSTEDYSLISFDDIPYLEKLEL